MNRAQKRALQHATAKASLAENDPIRVARELSASRDQVRAAFVMVRYLVDQLGGHVVIPEREFLSSGSKALHSDRDADGNVVLTVR